MTNFWSGGMRENEKKCHQGSLPCCIWQCLWATLSVSQKSWATAAIREDRHFQSRFLGGGWEEGQRERRREWGEKGGDGDEGRAHPVQPWHHSPALVYIQGMARASFRVHSLSKPAEGKRKPRRERSFSVSLSGPACQKAEGWWQDWTSSWFAWCFWLSAPGVSAQVSPTTSPNSLKWFLSQCTAAQVNESRSSSLL